MAGARWRHHATTVRTRTESCTGTCRTSTATRRHSAVGYSTWRTEHATRARSSRPSERTSHVYSTHTSTWSFVHITLCPIHSAWPDAPKLSRRIMSGGVNWVDDYRGQSAVSVEHNWTTRTPVLNTCKPNVHSERTGANEVCDLVRSICS